MHSENGMAGVLPPGSVCGGADRRRTRKATPPGSQREASTADGRPVILRQVLAGATPPSLLFGACKARANAGKRRHAHNRASPLVLSEGPVATRPPRLTKANTSYHNFAATPPPTLVNKLCGGACHQRHGVAQHALPRAIACYARAMLLPDALLGATSASQSLSAAGDLCDSCDASGGQEMSFDFCDDPCRAGRPAIKLLCPRCAPSRSTRRRTSAWRSTDLHPRAAPSATRSIGASRVTLPGAGSCDGDVVLRPLVGERLCSLGPRALGALLRLLALELLEMFGCAVYAAG